MINLTFASESEIVSQKLSALATYRTFIKGEHLFYANQSIRECYFLLSGRIKVYFDHVNGKRSIVDFFGPQDWLGEHSVFMDDQSVKENEVIVGGACWVFDIEQLKEACQKEAALSYYFANYLTQKQLSRTLRLSIALNYPLENRLAAFILETQVEGRYMIAHTDVSEYMNVSYRHVLHVIRHFVDQKILRKDKGYMIVNRRALEQLACVLEGGEDVSRY